MAEALPANLRVTVVGITLWATHPEQVSDVFLVIGLGAYSAKTQIRRRTQNVSWNEAFTFTLDKPATSIEVVVHEKTADGLRVIGTVSAPLSVVMVKPECTLTVTKENAPVGSVLLKLEPFEAYPTASAYSAPAAPTPAYTTPPTVSFAPIQPSYPPAQPAQPAAPPVVPSLPLPLPPQQQQYPAQYPSYPQAHQPTAPVEPYYTQAQPSFPHQQPLAAANARQLYPQHAAPPQDFQAPPPKNEAVAALEAEIRRIDAQNRVLTSKYQIAVECLRDSIQFEREELERSLTRMQQQTHRSKHKENPIAADDGDEEFDKNNRRENHHRVSERHRRRRHSRSRSRRRTDDNY